jgi:hypothetical protein
MYGELCPVHDLDIENGDVSLTTLQKYANGEFVLTFDVRASSEKVVSHELIVVGPFTEIITAKELASNSNNTKYLMH